MENIDPEEARRQLRGTYGQMTEEELCAVAEDANDLTPIAKETLQAVISERGLNIQVKPSPPQPVPIDTLDTDTSGTDTPDVSELDLDLVNVSRLWDADEAKRVKEILDAAFVQSFLGPDNIVDLEDFKSSFDGGVDLKVRGADYARACAALANSSRTEEDREEDPVEDAEEDLNAVHCPKCKSPEVVFQGKDPEPPDRLGVDSPFNWSCDACGYQWKDDGIEQ